MSLSSTHRLRFKQLTEIGCICCRKLGHKNPMVEIHHIVSGQRRQGHEATIPLCAYHHRGILPGLMKRSDTENIFRVSRHKHGRRAFEACWGTEQELLDEVNALL